MRRLVAWMCLAALASASLAGDVMAQKPIGGVDACGLVLDASGHGVAEATVSATSRGNVIATATTLSDGSFAFMHEANAMVELTVTARGFVAASGAAQRMGGGSARRCRHPLYAVLAVGNGSSYLTTKKRSLPKTK